MLRPLSQRPALSRRAQLSDYSIGQKADDTQKPDAMKWTTWLSSEMRFSDADMLNAGSLQLSRSRHRAFSIACLGLEQKERLYKGSNRRNWVGCVFIAVTNSDHCTEASPRPSSILPYEWRCLTRQNERPLLTFSVCPHSIGQSCSYRVNK